MDIQTAVTYGNELLVVQELDHIGCTVTVPALGPALRAILKASPRPIAIPPMITHAHAPMQSCTL